MGNQLILIRPLGVVSELDLPVLKLTTMSMRNIVSERQLKAIHLVLRSSLKKLMATGRIIRFATSRRSMQRSQ